MPYIGLSWRNVIAFQRSSHGPLDRSTAFRLWQIAARPLVGFPPKRLSSSFLHQGSGVLGRRILIHDGSIALPVQSRSQRAGPTSSRGKTLGVDRGTAARHLHLTCHKAAQPRALDLPTSHRRRRPPWRFEADYFIPIIKLLSSHRDRSQRFDCLLPGGRVIAPFRSSRLVLHGCLRFSPTTLFLPTTFL